MRFCEALLARHVLITEGRTEYDAFPAAARRLHELDSEKFKNLEAMGIAPLNAETDSQLAPLGQHFSALGKTVFALCDKQDASQEAAIKGAIPHSFLSPEKGFEELLLKHTKEAALRRYALDLVNSGDWPSHLATVRPTDSMPLTDLRDALGRYLSWSKGSGGAAELLQQCSVDEMPAFIVDTLLAIQQIMEPSSAQASAAVAAEATTSEGQ
jgi:putative ATP-dependent endonuclease of OLD family